MHRRQILIVKDVYQSGHNSTSCLKQIILDNGFPEAAWPTGLEIHSLKNAA